jgi:hypothetical protein
LVVYPSSVNHPGFISAAATACSSVNNGYMAAAAMTGEKLKLRIQAVLSAAKVDRAV